MKLVIGITGASGAIYAKLLIEKLRTYNDLEISVVFTSNAKQIFIHELGEKPDFGPQVKIYSNTNFYAPFASGSSDTDAMVVVPCSMSKLAKIANGISDDLITRAGDVFLKERKPLILVPRETPFNLVHIENMKRLNLAGATLIPAIPSFYSKPQTLEEAVMTVVDRVVDHLKIKNTNTYRWGAETPE